MSESKFLPLQDANGDGLNDVCDEVLTVLPPPCPTCIPNSAALLPNWRTKKAYEPFLNEKTCEYNITITTRYTSTLTNLPGGGKFGVTTETITEEEAEAALGDISDEYVELAIKNLLDAYNRDDSEASRALIRDVIKNIDWDLGVRPASRLKLLYAVPYDQLNALLEAADDEDEEEETTVSVSYAVDEMIMLLTRLRKGLWLYARNLKVYRVIESANILFLNDNSLLNLDEYGDYGFNRNASLMGRLVVDLDAYLNTKDMNLQGVGDWGGKNVAVEYLTFDFNEKYELKKLTIETAGCSEKPKVHTGKLTTLKVSGSPWTDPTATAYFAQMREMVDALESRTPGSWIDFVTTYTYPEVYTVATTEYNSTSGAALNCIGNALAEETKQLGQDILDEAFSLGDAIAYKFHEYLCATKLDDAEEIQKEMGVYLTYDDDGKVVINMDNVKSLALEQAFKQIESDDMMFADFCKWMFKEPGENNMAVDAAAAWAELRAKFDRLKLCGLLDLLAEALQCLFSGLTLEQALGKVIEAALNAMSVNNFGQLFIGLPADKQAELDALVKQKLESGDIFKDDSANQAAMDDKAGNYEGDDEGTNDEADGTETAATTTEYEKPWKNADADKHDWTSSTPGSYDTMSHDEWTEYQENPTALGTATAGLSSTAAAMDPNVVMQAYIQALIETYAGNELELVDLLGDFPGAPIITYIIATLSCPHPAFFNPSIADFIKSVELPICRDMKDIAWPVLMVPPLHKIVDLWEALLKAAKLALAQLIQKILMMLMVKLCEIIGEAICNALELVGDIAAAALTGNSITDAIKESICGEEVDDETLANTVAELFQTFGNGGAALSDTEEVMQFTADISSSVTRKEAAEAFLGKASPEFLTVVDNVIAYEHPNFRSAFNGPGAIAKAFSNMGNIMPVDFRKQLQDFVDDLDDDDQLPANPSLCLTPAQQEEFDQIRDELLQGRASPAQRDKLNNDFKDQLAQDLGDLAGIMQGGLPSYIEDNMPPLVSDPGCDNGILPYEPEEAAAAVAGGLGAQLEMLKSDYADDMLGNGPGKKNWGLINMILSDTMGQPLSVHHRKTANQSRRVDFYTQWGPIQDSDEIALPDFTPIGFFGLLAAVAAGPPLVGVQRGAYPYKVAEWLQAKLAALEVEYSTSNIGQTATTTTVEMKDLPGSGLFGGQVDYMKLPDLGYNITVSPDYEAEEVEFVQEPRKAYADVTLQFRDNAAGLKKWEGEFSYGFNIEAYLSDIEESDDGTLVNRPEKFMDEDGNVTYRPSDTTRILITNVFKPAVDTSNAANDMMQDPEKKKEAADKGEPGDAGEEMEEELFEFIAVDDSLGHVSDLEETYPTFAQKFTTARGNDLPQLVLLQEILENKGSTLSTSAIKSTYENTLTTLHNAISALIADADGDEMAWLYGAEMDTLSYADIEYVVKEGQTTSPAGTPYQDAEVDDGEGGTRRIRNRDMILGTSLDQLNNGDDARVTYLEPAVYGGNYMNPPLYISPVRNSGWLGMVDVLFPEMSACKPASTDLVDFGDIQEMIDDVYPTMPDDPRLFKDPDCATEKPYDRILNRSSKAFLIGLIMSTIRIYCSAHIVKTMSVFSKFAPKFPDVFSSIYAAYIVESMEKSMKGVAGGYYDMSTFKNNKFWYQFLEQSVQAYAFKITNEEIDPPTNVLAAMTRLKKVQDDYTYPDQDDRDDAKDVGEIPWFRTLKNYRKDENLEAIYESQEDAKTVLQEMVKEQLNFMSKKIVKNFDVLNMSPEIHDLDFYLLDNFTEGSNLTLNEAVDVDGSFQAIYPDLPLLPYDDDESGADEPYYTSGGQFVIGADLDGTGLKEGEEYIGAYHVHIDEEEGNVIYMVGEYHDEDEHHDILRPLVTLARIPVGDVPELGETSSGSQPFLVEKYIRITTGTPRNRSSARYSTSEAISIIKENPGTSLLSDVYPGSLRIVYDDAGEAVGLSGKLGVRYGLKFSVLVGSSYQELTSVEMDALDLPIAQFSTISADSGLMACLIKQLTTDDTFKLATHYIFPLRKMVSIMAVYIDMGFLPSIGQQTVDEGAAWDSMFSIADLLNNLAPDPDTSTKPGMAADVTVDDTTGAVTDVTYSGVEGWANQKDRPGPLRTLGFREWDAWDQVLLRSSKSRIKKLFKTHYNDRDFDFEEMGGKGVGQMKIKDLREAIKMPAGEALLPWWRKRRLRSNPYNANGELCENED
tara:strand:+ start:14321 stop:20926 length:6606 start_codon:yes stop_codon:yes gene_type:complete